MATFRVTIKRITIETKSLHIEARSSFEAVRIAADKDSNIENFEDKQQTHDFTTELIEK